LKKRIILVLTLGLVVALAWGFPFLKYVLSPLPDFSRLSTEKWVVEKFNLGEWTPLPKVSRAAVSAVLLSEDDAFYEHKGVSPERLKEALKEDLKERRFKRGASTITQQLARNLYLGKEKTLRRKARELVLARGLEKALAKDRILEIYLNVAEFGEGLRGIGPAAGFFFQKEPIELSPKEGAFLAVMLPSPIRYGKSFNEKSLTPYASVSIARLLDRMRKSGELSREQFEGETAKPLSFEERPPTPGPGTVRVAPEGRSHAP
jgi:monofunctional biosynthetic peptidoglycan transglycosylase